MFYFDINLPISIYKPLAIENIDIHNVTILINMQLKKIISHIKIVFY